MGLGDYFGDYNENLNLNAYPLLCALEDLVILLAQVLNNGPLSYWHLSKSYLVRGKEIIENVHYLKNLTSNS